MEDSKTKKRRDIEIYEEYWKFTAALTDIYGANFRNALSVIVNYIDHNQKKLSLIEADPEGNKKIFQDMYKELQEKLVFMMDFKGKDAGTSARKIINQFVKLGFINPYLLGYHKLVKPFLLETDKKQKQILYSKIFYETSSLASSVKKDHKNLNHIGFFLQTLDKNRILTVNDLKALMVTDITAYPNGYLTRAELDAQYRFVVVNDFEERKYNQISHLKRALEEFVDVKYDREKEAFYFADDPTIADKEWNATYKRDPIQYRIYRKELLEESIRLYGNKVCYLEKKPYMGLVTSHIKPCHICLKERNEAEAYDVNNGLLLGQNVDQYFDRFRITFTDDGSILFGKGIDPSIQEEYSAYSLDPVVLTPERKKYLAYHRKIFKERNE